MESHQIQRGNSKRTGRYRSPDRKNWLNIAEGSVSAEEMASNIRNSGVNHVYLSTDRGQAGFEHPVEGMLCFIETLLAQGFSEKEIKTMVCTVPGFIVSRNTTG